MPHPLSGAVGSEVKMCPADEVCSGPMRVPITFTYVLYDQGDLLGLLLAWSSLLPIFIVVGFLTLIVFTRDLHTIFFCAGLVLNELLNIVLKHIIQQPRPDTVLLKNPLFVVYGMPSSHAQFMTFFAAYFSLFIWIRVKFSSGVFDDIWKTLVSLTAIIGALVACISRVYLGYHSVVQVICGIGLGCLLGAVWFFLVHLWISSYFPVICSWSLSELCMVKDVSKIPNYLWFEYTSARLEARSKMHTWGYPIHSQKGMSLSEVTEYFRLQKI